MKSRMAKRNNVVPWCKYRERDYICMRRDATQNVTNFSLSWKTTSPSTAENTFSLRGFSLEIFHEKKEEKTMGENSGFYMHVEVSSFHQSFSPLRAFGFALNVILRLWMDALFVSLSYLFIYIYTYTCFIFHSICTSYETAFCHKIGIFKGTRFSPNEKWTNLLNVMKQASGRVKFNRGTPIFSEIKLIDPCLEPRASLDRRMALNIWRQIRGQWKFFGNDKKSTRWIIHFLNTFILGTFPGIFSITNADKLKTCFSSLYKFFCNA